MDVWLLQESTKRDAGLSVLVIPCASLEAAKAEADKRAGRLLDMGRAEGVDQSWQDYGVLPTGHDYVRHVWGDVWQHAHHTELVGS